MTEIVSQEELDKILKENKKVVVDFWAPWCGPCKTMLAVLEQVEQEFEEIFFCKIDVDEVPKLADTYKVRGIPTLIKFKNGILDSSKVGLLPINKIREWCL